MSDADEYARRIAVLKYALGCALDAAVGVASHASNHFNGSAGCILFNDVRTAIMALDDHPAMKALAGASIPPSMVNGPKK